MKHLLEINFAEARFTSVEGVVVDADGDLTMNNSAAVAELQMACFHPKLLSRWLAIELIPQDPGVAVALLSPELVPQEFDGEQWVAASEPVYQSLPELRQAISQWPLGIVLRWRLTRQTAITPRLRFLSLGYEVFSQGLADDFFRHALPSFLEGFPVELTRSAYLRDGEITLPAGLDGARVRDARFWSATQESVIPVLVADGRLQVPETALETPGHLQVAYLPAVTFQDGGDSFQGESVPSLIIRPQTPERRRQLVTPAQVAEDGQNNQIWHFGPTLNATCEVIAIGANDGEVLRIAQDQMAAINSTGGLYLAAHARLVSMWALRGPRLLPRLSDAEVARLSGATYTVQLPHLTEAAFVQQEPQVSGIGDIKPAVIH